MGPNLSYTTERYTTEMSAKEYIEQFRQTDYFVQLCKQCGNYGRRYGCPPFEDGVLSIVERYDRVWILGIKILPEDKTLPLSAANELILPVTRQLNQELLEKEQELKGYAFGFVGSCPYCDGAPCQRIEGKPCLHPELVRPSLEAFGFDMDKTSRELLGIEMKWSRDGKIPEYLTLVCGIFYSLSASMVEG